MAMQRKTQASDGFILLTVLIFVQLFSLIAMESIAWLIEDKRSIKLLARQRNLQLKTLSLISQMNSPVTAACSGGHYAAGSLPRKPLSWWQDHACRGVTNGGEYYYFQEPLELNVCNAENKSVRYDRNTLLYLPGKDFYSAMLYQSMITSINDTNIPCQGEPKMIPLGLQHLRQLY